MYICCLGELPAPDGLTWLRCRLTEPEDECDELLRLLCNAMLLERVLNYFVSIVEGVYYNILPCFFILS